MDFLHGMAQKANYSSSELYSVPLNENSAANSKTQRTATLYHFKGACDKHVVLSSLFLLSGGTVLSNSWHSNPRLTGYQFSSPIWFLLLTLENRHSTLWMSLYLHKSLCHSRHIKSNFMLFDCVVMMVFD